MRLTVLAKATKASSSYEDKLRKTPLNLQTTFQGLSITIEYKKGDRKPDKESSFFEDDWGWTQYADYGFINKTTSNEEGEGLDVFIGPNADSTQAFLFPLMDRKDPTVFNEYKLLLGFDSAKEALSFAHMQYCTDMVGGLIRTSIEDVKEWAELSEPLAVKLDRNPKIIKNEEMEKSAKKGPILTVPLNAKALQKLR